MDIDSSNCGIRNQLICWNNEVLRNEYVNLCNEYLLLTDIVRVYTHL